MKLAIIDYGAGNIQSLKFALKRLGVEAVLTSDVEEICSAEKVIFPGVGEASSAMKKLRLSGLDSLVPTLKQPVLGICLGMQLLCESSEEGNTQGLGIFKSPVLKFADDVKVPQIGWNQIYQLKTDLFKGINEKEYMYLVHSFYVPRNEAEIAVTDYGVSYATALKKDNFYGVQFHPEKSSKAGAKILKNFLEL